MPARTAGRRRSGCGPGRATCGVDGRPSAQHTARATLRKATRRGLAQLVQAEPGPQRPPEPVDRLRNAALEVGSGRIVASEIEGLN